MAKPFKITPTLEGKDAINFHSHIKSNRNVKVDSNIITRIQRNAKLFNSLLSSNK